MATDLERTTLPIDELDPADYNPRDITDQALAGLQTSVDKFGLVQDIVVCRRTKAKGWKKKEQGRLVIVGGHQRVKALAKLGQDLADVKIGEWTAAEEKALNLSLNNPKIAGHWTDDVTDLIQAAIDDVPDFVAGLELDTLMEDVLASIEPATPPEIVEPPAPEPPKKAFSKVGDLWLLGEHRVLCGDSTKREDVARVMDGDLAQLLVTDPPYNVSYQDNESLDSLRARNRRTDGLVVKNDAMSDKEFDGFLDAFISVFPLLPGGAFYICAPAGRTETQFRMALDRSKRYSLRQCIVWVKDRFVFGRQDYHWRHESILYGWRDDAAHYFINDKTQDTVWDFARPATSKLHPTMKPVELFARAIGNRSRKGEIVCDPFLGSGTTLIAAEQLGRRCFGIEISPTYVDVVLRRWCEFTGKEATRESDGATFPL